MSFLRVGTVCAVVDDQDRVLMSLRGDLNVWNLPGGRLDYGEEIDKAAAREVREETGVIAQIIEPVGLYYWQGMQRVNVLFLGEPIGGELQAQTLETRDNRWISRNEIQQGITAQMIHDTLDTESPPTLREITMQPEQLKRMRRKLRWRYVTNLLRGRPEPTFARFQISAIALIRDELGHRVLTLDSARMRTLPMVVCDGKMSPWKQLEAECEQYTSANLAFQWRGLVQKVTADSLQFVFTATIPEDSRKSPAAWVPVQNAPLEPNSARLLRLSLSHSAPIWMLIE